ncbi:hypothetical protein C7954_11947 [Halanaerobium congolense]|uniref:Uncharacterized protein n=1 Tax=Halanaerobium congolense TaxID=54121 RepID=A0A4R8GBZ6_9FIRM|nr:hypothetical protein [Halanaerobium congolense]TDX42936.1 hypothetical protein C7954_11947 [Halanaerobium congolense]
MEELSLILQNQIALLFDLDILSFSSTYYTISASLSVSILAIFLPLSIEVANRLSDKYQSDVLQEIFLENEIIKLMLKLNLANLSVIIIALVFRDDRLFLNKLNFLGFISFGFTIAVLYYFKEAFGFFVNFSSKKNWLLENIDKKMKLESEKEIVDRNLSDEMNYLDAKMKIVLSEVGKVSKEKIESKFDNLFQQHSEIFSGYKLIRRKEKNSIRIYKFLINQWFYFYEQIKENDYESQYLAEIITEFIAAEIYEYADQVDSEAEDKSNPELEYLLRKITTLYKQEINKSEEPEKLTLLTIRWYREYFYLVDDEQLDKNLNKLELLNSYIRKIIYYTVESGNEKAFSKLIEELSQRLIIEVPEYKSICYSNSLDSDDDKMKEIRSLEEELSKERQLIFDKKTLVEWQNKFQKYVDEINQYADKKIIEQKQINEEIKEALSYFKVRNRYSLSLYAGACCIYFEKYEWLNYFWDNIKDNYPNLKHKIIMPYDFRNLLLLIINYREISYQAKDTDLRFFGRFNYIKEFLILLIFKLMRLDECEAPKKKDISGFDKLELKGLIEDLEHHFLEKDFSVYKEQLGLTEAEMKSEFNDFKDAISDLL